MKMIFLITDKDIVTTPCGKNVVVTTEDGTQLNFTLEAAKEIVSDFGFAIDFIESGKKISEWPVKFEPISGGL